MKKLFLLLIAITAASMGFAQNSGLGFNYQAVVRNADGVLLANSDVNLRISLYPGQSATSPTWVETHTAHTDYSGCFGITVGKGKRADGSVASSYKDINFAAVYYWMKIEIQEGEYYREVSFAQLPSSPYSEVAHNASTFAGMIAPFAGPADKIPAGWLLCDGSAVSRSEYIHLYNAIGVCWGEGDGSTTFNLPDLRGMFLRQNNDIMLYVTETKDSKQASRNRLFVRWFNTYEHSDLYIIKTAEGKMDGQTNFMAIISRRDNPKLQIAIQEFEETVAYLFD